jgi:biotin-(acetyl-CoA carboxylase) ligase
VEYYLEFKNNDFMKFAGKWMELENIILSKVTQTKPRQKNTYGMYSLICSKVHNDYDTTHRLYGA